MRLDNLLYVKKLFPSRTKASQSILEGKVLYKNKPCKPSLEVDNLDDVTIDLNANAFVSNGGYKLKKAINEFNFKINGLTFADIGASNGGFTDCLLQHGAKKVFAIDVGETQLDKSIDLTKVVVLDNTNARYLDKSTLGEEVDGVVCDVSFISLKLILNSVNAVLKDGGVAVLLIKPQFECGKEFLGNSGIVRSVTARKNACTSIYNTAIERGLSPIAFTTAPIKEKKNIEYLIMLKKGNYNKIPLQTITQIVEKKVN